MKEKEITDRLIQQAKETPDKAEALRYVQEELKSLKESGSPSDKDIAEIYTVLAGMDRRFRRAVVDKAILDQETIEAIIAECAICSGKTDLNGAIKGGRWTFNEPLDSLKIVVDEGSFKVFGACNNC
ncbi:MAG: hypothetical protein HGA78_10265 [Nitrospirales bacterium]|nr:hypothetical protein [Nitrospirales bacterium]